MPPGISRGGGVQICMHPSQSNYTIQFGILPILPAKFLRIKELFGNISLAVLLNLVLKSVWILANNVVQDTIGHSEFGTFGGLYSLGFLFIAFSDLGLNQYATRNLAGDPSKLQGAFPSLFGLKLILSMVYPVFMAGVGWTLGYTQDEIWLLVLLCSAQALAQMLAFFRSNFQAFQRFRLDAFASILDRSILLGIVLFMLWRRQMTLESYVWAWITSIGIATIILYVLFIRYHGLIAPTFKLGQFKEMVKSAFPFAIITILFSVHDKIDMVMLERLASKKEAGLYAGAYRWVDAVTMYLWTVLPVFFARFAFFSKSQKDQKRLLDFGQPLAAIPMIFAFIFVLFYGEKMMFLFIDSEPEEVTYMTGLMKVLFGSVAINGTFAILSTLLTSTHREKPVSWLIFFSILLNFGLNLVFIPQHGAIASAWTTLASYSFLSLGYFLYMLIRMDFGMSGILFLKILLTSAISLGVIWGMDQLGMPWWLNTGMAGLACLGAVFAFGFIRFDKGIE